MRASFARVPLRAPRNTSTCLVLAGLLVLPNIVLGQASFEVVRSFLPEPGFPWGRILRAADGALYGTTYVGGPVAAGTVFRLDLLPGGGASHTTVHTFMGADGSHPVGDLIQASDGALYGTTCDGGAENAGVVFKLASSGGLTVFHHFRPTLGEGACPWAGLVEARDGNLYGSTNGYGKGPGRRSIFRMALDGTFTTLYSFVDPGSGAKTSPRAIDVNDFKGPFAALTQARDGHFYGTTDDSVFRITAEGIFTTLHFFTISEGSLPFGALIEAPNGDLYGTTTSMIPQFLDGGSAFKMAPDGVFTPLGPTPLGGSFGTLALGTDGAFYGASKNAVFRMTLAGEMTVLQSFIPQELYAGLVQAPNGNFYGTTTVGGPKGAGTVFEMAASGEVEYLHTFERNGLVPIAGLTQGTDGNLYGTTFLGGHFDRGTIFRMTTASAPRTLYNFGAGEIAAPGTVAPLFQAADGDFYGVASQSSLGAFFRMSPSGNVVRIRWFFTGFPGQEDTGPIDTGFIQGGDGRFYGTNQDLRGGSVLRIDVEQDRVDRLKVFERGTASAASLVEGSDGSFYGSTVSSITNLGGGRFQIGGGTIFRITGTGVYSLLHTFPPVGTGEGRHPTGALIQGRDGNIYGTTKDGGRATTDFQGMGTVFRMTPEGALTTLHQFDVAEGIHPWAGLAEGEDGAFYGTTPNGGLGHGTVYRITATGEFSIVHTFTGVDGSEPYAPLTLASDGSLYGITPVGGTAGMGAIFRVTPAAALPDRLLGKAK